MASDMHPEDVKAAIRKRGMTLGGLGDRVGLSPQALSRAIHSRSSAKAERVIAEFIGIAPQNIWPSRYDKTGRRLALLELRKVAA